MQIAGMSIGNTIFNCGCGYTVTTVNINIDSSFIIDKKAKVDL